MPNQFFSPEGDIENHFITESWLIDQYIGSRLWIWGNNTNGSLGINNTINQTTPVTLFGGGTDWKQVELGSAISAAIKNDGSIWTWGFNNFGALASNSSISQRLTPAPIVNAGIWNQVSVGNGAVAAIRDNGSLWVWGSNSSPAGILGINNDLILGRSTPVTTFLGGNDWRQVSAGSFNIGAIKTGGSLWVWGDYRGLGANDLINRSTPITTALGGNDWKQISVGSLSAAAIKTDGSLWVWGNNSFGLLGVNDNTFRPTPVTTSAGGYNWKQVSVGQENIAAIKTDGSLWVWGGNYYGQLGINQDYTAHRSVPVTTFLGGYDWKQVSLGPIFATSRIISAIKTDGSLWVWGGSNNLGLGIIAPNIIAISTPVTIFSGGKSWKQVSCAGSGMAAISMGL